MYDRKEESVEEIREMYAMYAVEEVTYTRAVVGTLLAALDAATARAEAAEARVAGAEESADAIRRGWDTHKAQIKRRARAKAYAECGRIARDLVAHYSRRAESYPAGSKQAEYCHVIVDGAREVADAIAAAARKAGGKPCA